MKTLILVLTILFMFSTVQAQNSSAYFTGKGKSISLVSGSQIAGTIYLKDDRGGYGSYDSVNVVLSLDDSADVVLQIYALEPLGGEGVADTITINPTDVAGEMINLVAGGAQYYIPWHNFIDAISTIQSAKGIVFRIRTRDDSGTYTDDPTKVYLYFKKYK